MRKSVKKIIGWVIYLAILVGLVYGIPKGLAFALDTHYPMASITSGSMWPALKKGDLVFIKGVNDKSDIEVGDIIVYQNPMGFTIHRVIRMGETTVVTKGDANNVADTPVEYSEVVGRTVELGNKPFRIPFLGNISILISKFR